MGITPGRYVEQIRVHTAQSSLGNSADPTESIARRCGLGSAETMRGAFQHNLGLSPADYRARFTTACPLDHPAPAAS